METAGNAAITITDLTGNSSHSRRVDARVSRVGSGKGDCSRSADIAAVAAAGVIHPDANVAASAHDGRSWSD